MEHTIQNIAYEAQEAFKLVLLGSSDVGKSSLVLRYVKDDFREIAATTGCAFFSRRVNIQDRILDFEIWDTAGQERYQSICHLYYRGAQAAMLVYDITAKETFTRAQVWLQELQKHISSEELVIALVGNKSDLQADRKVPQEDAQAFAEQKRLLFMETSAMSGIGVREIFEAMACELLALEHQKEDKERRKDTGVNVHSPRIPSVGNNCCQ